MGKKTIKIRDLAVMVGEKKVLDGLDLEVERGEVIAIVGKNGSGKSSLAMALMGNPEYSVQSRELKLDGLEIGEMSIDERSRNGLYVIWQNPVAIPGVSVFSLAKAAVEARGIKLPKLTEFRDQLIELAQRVGLPGTVVERDVNEGFSGGERKRLELMYMHLVKPKLVIMDEVDSGLDKSGRQLIVEMVGELREEGVAVIIITHYEEFVRAVVPNRVLEMKDGRLQARL